MAGDSRITRWGRHLLVTGGSQAAVQGIGLVSGLVIIRFLSTREFAYYTIANSALVVMTALTDGGVGNAVMALGGRSWQDDGHLGAVLSTGLALRRKFAIASVSISVPLLFVFLRRQGAGWGAAALISGALLVAFQAALTNQLFEIIPRLRQQIVPLQKIQAAGAVLRLALVVAAVLILPRAWAACLPAGLALTWVNIRMRRWVGRSIAFRGAPDPAVNRQILAQVARTLPGSLYYALLGQITVGLIALFGNNRTVANVGAAGRFAMLFGVVNAVSTVLLIPRFARMHASRSRNLAAFWGIIGSILVLGLCLVFVVRACPSLPGLVLGYNYRNTGTEVFLALLCSVFAVAGGNAYTLGAVRGRILAPWISIPVELGWQALVVSRADVTTARGVLAMSVWGALGPLVLYAAFNTWEILREGRGGRQEAPA